MKSSASLNLRMSYYVFNSGFQIRYVYIQYCNELFVKLDFRGVDATNFNVYFQSIQELHIEGITLEENYKDRQELTFNFYNIRQIFLSNLVVQDTFKFHAENIKEAWIANSTFQHVPVKGMTVTQANLLDIQNTTFIRVSTQSIIIEKTKKVRLFSNYLYITYVDSSYSVANYCNWIFCLL